MKVIGIILGIALIVVGITLLPSFKILIEAVFSDITDMDAFLTLLVSVWPIIVFLFFVYGAYMLARRG